MFKQKLRWNETTSCHTSLQCSRLGAIAQLPLQVLAWLDKAWRNSLRLLRVASEMQCMFCLASRGLVASVSSAGANDGLAANMT